MEVEDKGQAPAEITEPEQTQDNSGDDLQAKLEAANAKLAKAVDAEKKARARAQAVEDKASKYDALAKAQEESKRAKMDEVERYKADLERIQKEASEAAREAKTLRMERLVIDGGVLPEYADVVALKMEREQGEDFDAVEWLGSYKAKAPAMFSGNAPAATKPPPESASPGAPPNRGDVTDKHKRIQEIDKELLSLRSDKTITAQKRKNALMSEKFTLRTELSA